jgi:hypothetical protein
MKPKKRINNIFTHLNMLPMSILQVLVNAAVPSEDGIVNKWDFKQGSMERSIDDC